MSGSRTSGRVQERIERAAQAQSFEESISYLEDIIEKKGWVRTTNWTPTKITNKRSRHCGKYTLRFLKRKRVTESRGAKTYISTADGRGVFETEVEARAAIYDYWCQQEKAKGSGGRRRLSDISVEERDEVQQVRLLSDDEYDNEDDDVEPKDASAERQDHHDEGDDASDDGNVVAAGQEEPRPAVHGDGRAAEIAHPPKLLHIKRPAEERAGDAKSRKRQSFIGNLGARIAEAASSFVKRATTTPTARTEVRADAMAFASQRRPQAFLGFRRAPGESTRNHKKQRAEHRSETADTAASQRAQLEPLVAQLDELIVENKTYTLLVDYDKDQELDAQYTSGQLEYCNTQCEGLYWFMKMMAEYCTGERGGWSAEQCAMAAAEHIHWAYQPRTIMRWYNHNFVPNEGKLVPRQQGCYEREKFSDWFTEQSDLMYSFGKKIKSQLRKGLSLKKIAEIFNDVVSEPYCDPDESIKFDSVHGLVIEHAKGARQRTDKPEWYVAPQTEEDAASLDEHEPRRDVRSFIHDKFGISLPIKNGGTLLSIIKHPKIDMRYLPKQKNYYTDTHELQYEYRAKFLQRERQRELRSFKWVQLTLDQAEELLKAHEKVNSNAREEMDYYRVYYEDGSLRCVEFNVNSSSAFESFVANSPMGGNLSLRQFPNGPENSDVSPLITIGQDEKTYAGHALASRSWTYQGARPAFAKNEGQCLMVSGFVSRCAPFGFPVTREQLNFINELRSGEEYPKVEGGDVGEAFMNIQRERKVPDSKLTRLKPPIPEDEVVKAMWRRDGVPEEEQYVAAPGIATLWVGKGKEGYWTNENMLVHTVDMLDVYRGLFGKEARLKKWHPQVDTIAVLKFDWSAGHAKSKRNALNALSMLLNWGGTSIVRDTVIESEVGYLGPYEAFVEFPDGTVVDYKLKVGDTQAGSFEDANRPPWYDLKQSPGTGRRPERVAAPRGARDYRAAEIADSQNKEAEAKLGDLRWDFTRAKLDSLKPYVRARRSYDGRRRVAVAPTETKPILIAEASAYHEEEAPITIDLEKKPDDYDAWKQAEEAFDKSRDGFLGEAKGLKHYLFERGWYDPDGRQSLNGTRDKYGVLEEWVEVVKDSCGNRREILVSSSLRECAARLPDFQSETSVLAQLIHELGHEVDFTPKCHPEIAGEGIEYMWGKSAYEFRHHFNDEKHANQKSNVFASLSPQVLPLARIRTYERVVSRYEQVYRALHDENKLTEYDAVSANLFLRTSVRLICGWHRFDHGLIEHLQKERKRHRDVDFELKLIEGGRFFDNL